MRWTTAFLLIGCLHVAARGKAQQVTYSASNEPLQKVFAAIEQQTGYVFFYDIPLLRRAKPVSIELKNAPLEQALNAVLKGQPLTWTIEKQTIIISPGPMPAAPPAADTTQRPSDQATLSGFVSDMNGEPLTGASVTVRETGKSTITDGHGVFQVQVPRGKTKIIISYVGYTTREILVPESQRQMLVQMTIAVNILDEEVVQGYGKTSQRLAVGSIVKVSGADIQKMPVMNPLLALNGRVPGLQITPTSGYVSAPVKVEIRGRNTINPTLIPDPLYVIDGVPLTILELNTGTAVGGNTLTTNYANGSTGFVQGGLFSNTKGQSPLFAINPADIESISVLKDAAATAIYGSRGANGVILITTRKAKPGKTALNLQVKQSISTAPKHWDMLNTAQYLQMRREALKNDGLPVNLAYAPDIVSFDTTRYTDWQKELWGVAKSTGVTMQVSGGDQHTSFTFGAGYDNAQDITTLKGSNQRVTASLGLQHRSPDQKLTIDFKALYTYTYVNAIQTPNLTTLPPDAPSIFDAKGNLNYAAWNAAGLTSSFPFGSILTPSITGSNFLNSSININYALAKGLSLGVTGGYNFGQTSLAWYSTIASQNPINKPTGTTGFGSSLMNNWTLEPQLNYSTYIGAGRLDCMTGGTYQNSNSSSTTSLGIGYTNDALMQTLSNAPYQSSSGNAAKRKYANLHGRINYDWRHKYIIELAGNRDGSSNFGPGRQFGNFWSAGGNWIASEEEWLKNALPSWWSFIKLNATYGVTGVEQGASYQYLSQWSTPTGYYFNYNGVTPLVPVHAVNQDFQWQENRKINADLSLGFLKDRISLTLTWYRDRCNNQLMSIPTPAFTGFTGVTGNSPANVENSGWEAMLNAQVIKTKDLFWQVGFNIGINRNKLVSYPDFQFSPYYATAQIGKSLNTVYLYHYTGINPQTGQRSLEDYNHNGTIGINTSYPAGTLNDDRYISLDVTPKYIGGVTSQLSYKRMMVTLFVSFKKQLALMPFTGFGGVMGNIPVEVFNNHWQKPGDQTRFSRFSTMSGDANFAVSDGAYTDASFVRLSNLYVSYSLPDTWCKKAHLQGASFSLSGSNLFTITRYTGVDPEVNNFGSLPQPRIIAGTLSFTL